MTTSTDVEAQLQAIRQSYCASLPDKLARIEELWKLLQPDGTDKHNYDEFYRLLHSIAGSAETFGLPRLTQVARAIVQQLKTGKEMTALANIAAPLAELSRLITNITQK